MLKSCYLSSNFSNFLYLRTELYWFISYSILNQTIYYSTHFKACYESVVKEADSSQKGVTDKLQEVLKKVKTTEKVGIYDDLYGESFSAKVGSSWAYSSVSAGEGAPPAKVGEDDTSSGNNGNNLSSVDGDNDDDDLFG